MSKKILGLDLGTNSIGWALVEQDTENKKGEILGMGSRIIPMDEKVLGEFGKGNSVSQTAKRTKFRSVRRLYERNHLRRERLHRVLNVLGFLPEHYARDIDFKGRLGKFKEETETKLVWRKNGKKENGKDKLEFIFQSTFNEMLIEFKKSQPDLFNKKNRKGEDVKIPYDWTIYYLRKKALTEKIAKEELAWLILNFNQKRGYYQLRGEEEETASDKKEFVALLKIIKVEKEEVDKKNDKKTWYSITFENGWKHSFPFTSEPNWLNTQREFLVVEEYDENGCIKIVKDRKKDTEGREKRTISTLPSFEEIDLMVKKDQDKIYKKIKARTEITIENSSKTVGSYIYETLLQNPTQKIRGKLVRTIERKFYKEELKAILEKQIELQPELFTDELYNACIRELYRSNEAHQLQLSEKDFVHLFLNDIIFYQRPLRSQKSSIGNCSLEFVEHKISKGKAIKRVFEKDENGNDIVVRKYLKAIPKSNPYYQEFRVWQWLYNLRIFTKTDDSDVTATFLRSTEDWENLFEFLMTKKEVNHIDILNYLIAPAIKEKYPETKPKALKEKIAGEIVKYRWNYVFDDSKEKEDEKSKRYPMNETGYEIRRRLENVENVSVDFLKEEINIEKLSNKGREIVSLGTIEYQLWHIIYSVTDQNEFEKALETFARKYSLYHVPKSERDNKNPDKGCFVENFKNFKPFKSEYGSYSEKAIKKLLPLMRIGKYWKWENIDAKTQTRIEKILTGEFDTEIHNRVRENAIRLTEKEHFQGLQLWLASYVVYDRHSEAGNISKWNSAEDLKKFLNEFKQHSLRNPIVEQVVTETLRVVGDIWEKYGNGTQNFFDEIHIELGRELKNTAEDRKRVTNQVSENENTNLRIKALLAELKSDSSIENVRPHSPMQQEILKIYEEYALGSNEKYNASTNEFIAEETPEDILKISKTAQPSKSELMRYKLWLEQKYRSPYTGEMIPLSKLFTSAYEIEHIIPQSRYFDDSFSNKVICETAVNKLKDHQLGLEFIKAHHGEIVETGLDGSVKIFTESEYKNFVTKHYVKNRGKKTKLLLEEIPEKMIERQMNDTRYISKYVSSVLSNIVRDEKDDDGINSKNVITVNGKITAQLRQDWGLNDVWNELILPRFERMNELTKTTVFTSKNTSNKIIPTVPLELSKGFQKKRIDHRHHAMDALVIACATRDHVNLLNNQSAKSDTKRYDLQYKLRNREKWTDKDGKERDKFTEFKKPWEMFTQDTRNELERMVVSFKQNLRVINKTKFGGLTYKESKEKSKNRNWAIRKPMHEETISGLVKLNWVNVGKNEIVTATRKALDKRFSLEKIKKITDTGIQKILTNYLTQEKFKVENEKGEVSYNTDVAFSPEGIEDLNKNIVRYNNGKFHQPILKVRLYEKGNGRFALGEKGNKKDKYVQGAPNLFFAVYTNQQQQCKGADRKPTNRCFETIPLNIVIERQKQGLSSVPQTNEIGETLLFYLSPNDLVYVPIEGENVNAIDFNNLTKDQIKRIFAVNDFSGSTCYFRPNYIAKSIAPKEVDLNFDVKKNKLSGSFDTKTASLDGKQIKDVCIKLQIDRLGNISKA